MSTLKTFKENAENLVIVQVSVLFDEIRYKAERRTYTFVRQHLVSSLVLYIAHLNKTISST